MSHDVISGHVFSDTFVVTTNQQCTPLLDQTVKAAASGVDFVWSTSLPYLAVRGVFVKSEDVGGFVVHADQRRRPRLPSHPRW